MSTPREDDAQRSLYAIFSVVSVAAFGWFAMHVERGGPGASGLVSARGPIFVGMLPWIASLLLVSSIMRQVRQSAERKRALEPGHVAQAEGDLVRAVAVYDEVAKSSTDVPQAMLSARLLEGSVLLQSGRFDEADAVLAFVERRGKGSVLGALSLAAQAERALLLALRGRIEDAQRAYDATTKTFARALDVPAQTKQRLVLVNAIVASRTDRPTDAQRLLEARWPVIVQGGGSTLRLALLLRALLAASTSGPRDAGNADRWLVAARALGADMLLSMCTEWPAMTMFAQGMGLRAYDPGSR